MQHEVTNSDVHPTCSLLLCDLAGEASYLSAMIQAAHGESLQAYLRLWYISPLPRVAG